MPLQKELGLEFVASTGICKALAVSLSVQSCYNMPKCTIQWEDGRPTLSYAVNAHSNQRHLGRW